jgi:CRP-like cAMP-binding protein
VGSPSVVRNWSVAHLKNKVFLLAVKMSEQIWYLTRCSLFQSVTPEELFRFESRCQQRTISRGTVVYTPRDTAEGVLLLTSGQIKIYTTTNEGKEAILCFIKPGEIFGELALLDTAAREEYAEACEASTVMWIPIDAIDELMSTHAQVGMAVMKLISFRKRRLERRLKGLLFRSTRERLVHALLELAEEYGQLAPCGIELQLRLSHQELASLIGSTRESVTIVLGDLQAEGMLRVGRKRIVLTDSDALAQGICGYRPIAIDSLPAGETCLESK